MRLKSFYKSSGLTALAVGLAALALPSVASADPGDNGRGGWNRGGENRGGGERAGGGERRGGGQGQAQAPAPQAQPQARNWGGDRNGAAPGRGWGSQRPEGGQRYGRDWTGGGQVVRPEPALRNRAPDVRQAPAPQRNWVDRNRDGANTPRQQGWDGQRWQGQNNDRSRVERTVPQQRWDGNRDRYDRNRGDWDRNRSGYDRDRGGYDRNRGGWDRNRSGGNWNRDWRRDNRYNWQSYRTHNRHIYNLGRYYSPYNNWSYRRLNIGFYLQPLFFSQSYWIDDPWQYRLPEAYGPYRWVRYYDDALLVDIYSGEVVDVLYDFFW